jgi:hypothetical protein
VRVVGAKHISNTDCLVSLSHCFVSHTVCTHCKLEKFLRGCVFTCLVNAFGAEGGNCEGDIKHFFETLLKNKKIHCALTM